MLACVTCRIPMKCVQNGVACDYKNGHIYVGDLFQCPECLNAIISTNQNASYDPEYKFVNYYLPMKSNQIKEISQNNIDKILIEKFRIQSEKI